MDAVAGRPLLARVLSQSLASRFEAALQEAGKEATIHVSEGADHAFVSPSGKRYDAEVAENSWARTTASSPSTRRGSSRSQPMVRQPIRTPDRFLVFGAPAIEEAERDEVVERRGG